MVALVTGEPLHARGTDVATRRARLERGGRDRIAALRVAGVEAAPDPAHALLGAPGRERLRHHAPLALLLQAVVADRRRGGQRLLDVAGLELVHRAGVVSPHAGIAIGLQFHAHRQAVLLRRRSAPARGFHLAEAAAEVLYVMRDLMGDDIGLGEIARGAKALLQVAEKREVDVQLFVARTVERPHRRLSHAAGGAHLPFIQNKRGRTVAKARILEHAAPHLLGAAEHFCDELPGLVRRRALGGVLRGRSAAGLLGHVHHRSRVDAKEVSDQRDDDAAHAEPAADHAHPAPVLDVVARALIS